MTEKINHPAHYNQTPIEAILAMEAVCRSGASRSAALKYLARVGHKGPAHEDLRKAAWYVRRLVTADHSDFFAMDESRASEIALTWTRAAKVKSNLIGDAIFALLTGCEMILTDRPAKWTTIASRLEELASIIDPEIPAQLQALAPTRPSEGKT